MAKTDYKTIDDYVADLSDENKIGVRAICDAIAGAVPEAEGVISYQIPAFRYHGWIFYVSAHKDHYSLSCPPPIAAFEAFKDELARYAETKSALKLPKKEPLPIALIKKMAACHAQYNVEQASKKEAKKTTAVEQQDWRKAPASVWTGRVLSGWSGPMSGPSNL